MSYDSTRRRIIHDIHQARIIEYAKRYRPGFPTIVLLPGGMGSQLDRSPQAYTGDGSVPGTGFQNVWLDLGVFFGRDAELVEIQSTDLDLDDHIVVANGPLLFPVNAYDGTKRFFEQLGWNYIVFAYDWRRPIAAAAAFLEEFLAALKAEVLARKRVDPSPSITLLAHSQGGLVAKAFLSRIFTSPSVTPEKVATIFQRFVSVGTPFYGTSSHQDRYYIGQSPLHIRYGREKIARVAGSLPGPYILMFADRPTLDRDGPTLGLKNYPITDADTNKPADPYDEANLSRYPAWVNPDFLSDALDIRGTITAPFPEAVIDRVFHIRSGQNKQTGALLKWKAVDVASFDPEAGISPVRGVAGPGDGTVPFWAARLAQTAPSHIYSLRIASDHGGLLEHDETLQVLQKLIENDRLPKPATIKAKNRTLGVKKASRAAAHQLVEDIVANKVSATDPRANDQKTWRRLIEDIALC
jgi:pimeloyl-ACP methyl ester carboxylesterase